VANPTEIRHRAAEANRLLNDPLLVEALDAIELSSIERLLSMDALADDADRQRRIMIDRVNVIRDIRSHLKVCIEIGLHEAHQPDRRV
jgi:hypothetical protein